MKKFFNPSFLKLIFCLLIFAAFIPFLKIQNSIVCVTFPCPVSSNQSIISHLFNWQSRVVGLEYTTLIWGVVLSYLSVCLIAAIIRKIKGINV